MIKYKVLVTAEVYSNELLKYRDYFDFKFAGYGYNHEMLHQDDLEKLIEDVDILISEFDKIDSKVIDCAKSLKMIICCRGGVGTVVDVDYAKNRGIVVCNCIGRNKKSAAIHVLAMTLDLICNITKTNTIIHSSKIDTLYGKMPIDYGDSLWGLDVNSPYQKYRAPSIENTVIGIIGYGNVGSEIRTLMKSVGFKTIVYDRSSKNKKIPNDESRTLYSVLNESDVVVLAASGNNEKKAIFTSKEFSQMKQNAYFINISRGYLVDESALIYALNNHVIAGAAVDVTRNEPLLGNDPLIHTNNLIITPHIGGSSIDTINEGTKTVVEILNAFVSGAVIPNRV